MKNLKRIREKKKMRKEELAYKSGVSFAAIQSYEAGTRNPSLVTAKKIAHVLGISVEELG